MKLLISVVPHDKGERLTKAAMESGCRGGTVLIGRGLSRTNLMAVLGLGESTKDVILMIVEEQVKESVFSTIVRATSKESRNFGELFVTDVDSFFRSGSDGIKQEDETGNSAKGKAMKEMISVIVNKGYADDVMAAARSAGAGGGTVLNARGTARETDEQFFGTHIVPEKEMLIMVVPTEKKEAVMEAIRNLKCLKTPGMGIAYSSAVEDFTMLGRK
ncbi:MAG: transcriptional regulator [Treponema sp.]|nr:transcriptional regulator [Treponema sp.]